jgi:DNA-binding MarR family transcriptional regulator
MTQLITRLEKEGLARRDSDPADGRAVVVSITDAGRAALARRREGRARALSGILQNLPATDHAALLAALPAMERLGGLIAEQT